MHADLLLHIGQVDRRIDIMQFTGADQALDGPYMFGTDFHPAEDPVPSFKVTFPETTELALQ